MDRSLTIYKSQSCEKIMAPECVQKKRTGKKKEDHKKTWVLLRLKVFTNLQRGTAAAVDWEEDDPPDCIS
jgi:hypothetical protein